MNPEDVSLDSTPLLNAAVAPTDEQVEEALGASGEGLKVLLRWLQCARPDIATQWKFSIHSGWYRAYMTKQRKLFYLVPRPGGFRLALVLDDKALGALRRGHYIEDAAKVIEAGRRVSNGTAFTLESSHFDPEMAIALVAAKLAS